MPVEAGPTPDPEYLRATQLGLQMDEDFLAADEPPPAGASPPPGAAEEAERLLALFRDPSAAPGRLDLEGLRGLRGRARTQALLLAEAAPAAAAPPATWQWLAGRLAGAGGGAAGQGGGGGRSGQRWTWSPACRLKPRGLPPPRPRPVARRTGRAVTAPSRPGRRWAVRPGGPSRLTKGRPAPFASGAGRAVG